MPSAKPVWLGYVAVPDIDAAVVNWTAAGGSVQMPSMDVPNVGRMAMLADPDGVPLYLMDLSAAGLDLLHRRWTPR